jgi:predicted MPP superfamily phosphohydrolase
VSDTLVRVDVGRSRSYPLVISTHDVPIRGLPDTLHGTSVVHLSDFHGGFGSMEPVYAEAIERVNALQPDLILLTGDYVDDHAPKVGYPIQNVLKQFRARLGVFGSFGNHDHRRGISQAWQALEQAGVRVLNNTNVQVEPGLWLAGVDDLEEGEPDVACALAGLPDDVTAIVLSHNPRLVERLGSRDALILSGHTHGGQIVPPLISAKIICYVHLRRCRQVAGWYANGRTREYVSRGLGVTGLPFRWNCPAEIPVFRLLPAATKPA